MAARGPGARMDAGPPHPWSPPAHPSSPGGGTGGEPPGLGVAGPRTGPSFTPRGVVARQSEGAILNLSCSFQVVEDQIDVQESSLPTDVGKPGSGTNEDWGLLARRVVHRGDRRASSWMKVAGPLGDDPILHACAVAYASDDLATTAVGTSHPRIAEVALGNSTFGDIFIGASLDHSIWFHRSAPADEWQLHEFRSHGLTGGRGLTIGEIFASDGTHVATVAQDVLIRERTR